MTDHDPTYIAGLATTLRHSTEYRISYPGHPTGHLTDLLITRRLDTTHSTWAILRADGTAWTGTRWEHCDNLHPHTIYPYTRTGALAEAARITRLETEARNTHMQLLRDADQKENQE